MKINLQLITSVFLSVFFIQTIFSQDKKKDATPEISTFWKYEQVMQPPYDMNGIAKKIYFIKLGLNGTYRQIIQIIPNNEANYLGVKRYEISGKWWFKDNKMIFEEYDKKNVIDYNYFNNNFVLMDNVIDF